MPRIIFILTAIFAVVFALAVLGCKGEDHTCNPGEYPVAIHEGEEVYCTPWQIIEEMGDLDKLSRIKSRIIDELGKQLDDCRARLEKCE